MSKKIISVLMAAVLLACTATLFTMSASAISTKTTQTSISSTKNSFSEPEYGISWDFETMTLTLNNANINITTNFYAISIFSPSIPVTIKLVGENRITTNSNTTPSIAGTVSELIFTGDGSLSVVSNGNKTYALSVSSNLTFDNTGEVSLQAGSAGINCVLIGAMVVKNSKLTVSTTDSAGVAVSGFGKVSFDNCFVTDPSSGLVIDGGKFLSGGTQLRNLTISPITLNMRYRKKVVLSDIYNGGNGEWTSYYSEGVNISNSDGKCTVFFDDWDVANDTFMYELPDDEIPLISIDANNNVVWWQKIIIFVLFGFLWY